MIRSKRGQTLIEFTVIIPALCLFLIGLFHVGKLLLLKQSTLTASRYQAWHILRRGRKPSAPELRRKFFPHLGENISASPPFKVSGGDKIESSHPIYLPGGIRIFEQGDRFSLILPPTPDSGDPITIEGRIDDGEK